LWSNFSKTCASKEFYLLPTAIGTGGDLTYETATERNSFRAVKNQKIACDFLIFYRSLPVPGGEAAELVSCTHLP
jgi:hypothetical protein